MISNHNLYTLIIIFKIFVHYTILIFIIITSLGLHFVIDFVTDSLSFCLHSVFLVSNFTTQSLSLDILGGNIIPLDQSLMTHPIHI